MKRQNYIKSATLYMLAMLLPKFISLITLPIFSNILSAESYGICSFTNSIIQVVTAISTLGLNVYYLVFFYKREEDEREYNGTFFWGLAISNVIILIIASIVLYFISRITNFEVPFFPYILFALLTNFFYCFELIPMRNFRIKNKVDYYFCIIMVKTIITVALNVLFIIVLRLGTISLYLSDLISSFLFTLVFINYMRKEAYLRIKWTLLKKALKYSIPIVPSNLAFIGNSVLENMLIANILNIASLGIFALANNVAAFINMTITSMLQTIEPDLYKRSVNSDFMNFIVEIKRILQLIVLFVCCGVGLFGQELFQIFFSESYKEVWIPLQVLSFAYSFNGLASLYRNINLTQSKNSALMLGDVCGCIISVVANLLLLNKFQLYAAGFSTLFYMITRCIISYLSIDITSRKSLKLGYDIKLIILLGIIIFGSRVIADYLIFYRIVIKLIIFTIFLLVVKILYHVRIDEIRSFVQKRN